MRILVLGGDGYLGWPTAMYFSKRGHDVHAIDSYLRRRAHAEQGTDSLTPIPPSLPERTAAWKDVTGLDIGVTEDNICEYEVVERLFREFQPEAVVHYGEMPSAPYSHKSREHAVFTQYNNVVGTLNVLWAMAQLAPQSHLVKLGTMGEYGTPNIDIEEGFIEINHNGRSDTLPFPKQPGSFYHLSKVHDSHNIEFGCRAWGLRATDLNQGIVYGQETPQTSRDPRLATRFDYDAIFGTVLNRFVVQAVLGQPLTVYGEGGQTRGVIDIRDTVECIRLASERPAEPGEFRVFNQMTESMSVAEIAKVISSAYPQPVEIDYLDNPRVEASNHYYNVVHTGLVDLGLEPHRLSDTLITSLFDIAERHKHRADLAALRPTVDWRKTASSPRAGHPAAPPSQE